MAGKSFKNITRAVLEVIGELGRVAQIGFSQKTLTQKMMLMELGYDPFQINKTVKRLTKQEYIDKKLKEKTEKYVLTKKGMEQINFLRLENLPFDEKSKKWDGNWRVVIFDIPETIRGLRDAFREKLHEWPFYKLQNSVFVCPYECREEIKQACKILKLEKYVLVLKSRELSYVETKLRKHFGIIS
jgi:CRISPR-associated endonuclease Cas2